MSVVLAEPIARDNEVGARYRRPVVASGIPAVAQRSEWPTLEVRYQVRDGSADR